MDFHAITNNIEFFIVVFILLSFVLYYKTYQPEQEGACVSRPFSLKKTKKNKKDGTKVDEDSATSSTSTATQNMLEAYVEIVDTIDADMSLIKSIIPINVNLGIVNNTDEPSSMSIYGTLPNLFLNFSIKNPPTGNKGIKGIPAEKYGKQGSIGPTGSIGETGYWGTTQNTLY